MFTDAAPTAIFSLSLHDALPICADPLAAYAVAGGEENLLRINRLRQVGIGVRALRVAGCQQVKDGQLPQCLDRKSTRLNSSHVKISYAVFCLKKKNRNTKEHMHN